MATLSYQAGIVRYRRYFQAVQNRPILQASLFLVFSLLLIIALIALALRPTLVTMSGLLGQIDKQKDIERQLDQKIAALSAAQQNHQIIASKLTLLDQAIPTSAQFATWSQIVDTLASSTTVEITNLTLTEVPIAKTLSETRLASYPFSITARGEYSQLKLFLTALENTRRIVSLDNLTLSQAPQTSTDGRLQLIVNGTLTLVLP